MQFNWKLGARAVALSAALLSMAAGAQVAPTVQPVKPVKPPVEVVKPAPSAEYENPHGGQHFDKGKPKAIPVESKSGTILPTDAAPPSADRGHLCDPHPSCKKLTSERAATPPPR